MRLSRNPMAAKRAAEESVKPSLARANPKTSNSEGSRYTFYKSHS